MKDSVSIHALCSHGVGYLRSSTPMETDRMYYGRVYVFIDLLLSLYFIFVTQRFDFFPYNMYSVISAFSYDNLNRTRQCHRMFVRRIVFRFLNTLNFVKVFSE